MIQRARQLLRRVELGHVMDVDHGRGDVGVAHVRLDVGEREYLDGQGAERVAEVVEPDRLEARAIPGFVEATAKGRILEVLTGSVAEDEVFVTGELIPAAQLVESACHWVNEGNAA